MADHPTSSSDPVQTSSSETQTPQRPSSSSRGKKGGYFLSDSAFSKSLAMLPLAGYALLSFTVLDFVYLLFPPRLTDPVWQFEVMTNLVERVWAPLLGFVFIFYNRQERIERSQMRQLRFLSWLALLFALFYFGLLPLGIGNTWRIYQLNEGQYNSQIAQQAQQFQTLRDRLEDADTIDDLNVIAAFLNRPLAFDESIPQLKQQLAEQIDGTEQNAIVQLQTQWENQKTNLFKNFIKLNLGAVLSGAWLIIIWRWTRWTRKNKQ
ncbi:HpsJ family protein [Spirulina sp. CS-785/01]|uniref:HpsJ-like protein, cyanoexosortase A-associated n=1 Tax=Spirulina sp. CS-785/01 TaxID=3021716 RepID=UPI0023310D0D|nr:HpsJ family protein [Spirulina sp. CS-785/01]MDB9315925.1 HpsJ family protein [Spirulina sp. CS-785/01]